MPFQLQFRRKWTTQPQYPVEIDRANPLTKGLVDAYIPLSVLNPTSVRGYPPSISAGPVTISAGQLGRNIVLPAATLNGGLIISDTADAIFPSTTETTIFIIRRSLDTTNRESTLFGYDAGAGSRVLCHAPWSDGNIYFDFSNATEGAGRVSTSFVKKSSSVDRLVFVAGGGKGREIWRDGIKIAANTGTSARASSTLNVRIGGTQGISSDNEEIYLFGVVNRAWSDAEISEWYENPWQIFRKQPKVLYFDVAGGGPILVNAVDTLTPTLAEVTSLLGTSSVTDVLTPAIVEGTNLLGISSVTDTLTPTIVENAALTLILAVVDVLTPTLTETATVGTSEVFNVSAFDSLAPALSEAQQSTLYSAVLDALTISLGEVQGSLLYSTVTDIIPVNLSESVSVFVVLTATDTLIVSVTDTAAAIPFDVIVKAVNDTCILTLTEFAAVNPLAAWQKSGVLTQVWSVTPGSANLWDKEPPT